MLYIPWSGTPGCILSKIELERCAHPKANRIDQSQGQNGQFKRPPKCESFFSFLPFSILYLDVTYGCCLLYSIGSVLHCTVYAILLGKLNGVNLLLLVLLSHAFLSTIFVLLNTTRISFSVLRQRRPISVHTPSTKGTNKIHTYILHLCVQARIGETVMHGLSFYP